MAAVGVQLVLPGVQACNAAQVDHAPSVAPSRAHRAILGYLREPVRYPAESMPAAGSGCVLVDPLERIRRLTGELLDALLAEFGPEHAAALLEHAAAEVRA